MLFTFVSFSRRRFTIVGPGNGSTMAMNVVVVYLVLLLLLGVVDSLSDFSKY